VIGNNGAKIDFLDKQSFFNYCQQELQVYSNSMHDYQSAPAFKYYLERQNENDQGKVEFSNLSIESFVYDSILVPVQQVFKQTSHQFMNRYLMS